MQWFADKHTLFTIINPKKVFNFEYWEEVMFVGHHGVFFRLWNVLAVALLSSVSFAYAATDTGIRCVYNWKHEAGLQKEIGSTLKDVCDLVNASDLYKGARIGDSIVVKFNNLASLVDEAECTKDGKPPAEKTACTSRDIVLFLDGKETKLKTNTKNARDNKLHFKLEMNKDTRALWVDLLGAPEFSLTEAEFKRRATLASVGLAGQSPYAGKEFDLIRVDMWWLNACAFGLIALLVLTIWLGHESDLLREAGPDPKDVNGKTVRKPYSLARCHLAFWFYTVVVAFIMIFLVTKGLEVSATALAIIGISGTTFLAAALIDNNTDTERPVVQDDLAAQRSKLAGEVTELNTKITALNAANQATAALDDEVKSKSDQMKEIDAKVAKIKAPRISQHFLHDILTDSANNYSLHRFQMVVWSLVMWMVFLYSVWHDLTMPEFSATLLGMMGISNATYLGFKVPESNASLKPKVT